MIDPATFRQVMGNYPTGVCAVTASTANGIHIVMIVGSFTSVSLDPPLIGFFPDKRSSSWPVIEAAGKFCVNVLGSDQVDMCRQMSAPGPGKLVGVDFDTTDLGSPVLENAIAWIDCTVHQVVEAGDHYLVLGLVNSLGTAREHDPMLFFKGQFGGFAGAL